MIIRERLDSFVMIDQHHHASLSGKLFDNLKSLYTLQEKTLHLALRHAIYYHDVGWIPFDLHPFWDDQSQAPYSFITFPNSVKVVLYQSGIDTVQEVNAYAGLLCSEHYRRFLNKDYTSFPKKFVHNEKIRQNNLIHTFEQFNYDTFQLHYEVLQFFDNLSLYLCLHEPDTNEDDIHYFFKNGITLPKLFGCEKLQLFWDNTSVVLDKALFHKVVNISLTQKVVPKTDIKQYGLVEAWQNAPSETIDLYVKNFHS